MLRLKVLKSGAISEDIIQKTVIEWVKLNPYLKKIIIHVPNEGKRSQRYGKRLKDMGMVAGVWDILIASPRKGFPGAWIELKSKDGKLSAAQKEFGDNMTQEGYFTAVCYSIDEAINTIKWYLDV